MVTPSSKLMPLSKLLFLFYIVAEHFTSHESIKTELSEIQEKARISGGRFKQNQRFEEMRKLQDDLAEEQKEWRITKDTLEKELEAKYEEKLKIQSEIDKGLKDVKEQREQLYRKLEVLRNQGIELGQNLSVSKKEPTVSTNTSSSGSVQTVVEKTVGCVHMGGSRSTLGGMTVV